MNKDFHETSEYNQFLTDVETAVRRAKTITLGALSVKFKERRLWLIPALESLQLSGRITANKSHPQITKYKIGGRLIEVKTRSRREAANAAFAKRDAKKAITPHW